MTDKHDKSRSRTLLVIGLALVVAGLLSVATYVVNFIGVLDQADQSMAFWLLPLLQFGLAASGVGTVLVVLWLLLISTDRSEID
jgi:hypothetical protein